MVHRAKIYEFALHTWYVAVMLLAHRITLDFYCMRP